MAEELVSLFARVGIPKEILTDQGTNFTMQLLQELYCMLHLYKSIPPTDRQFHRAFQSNPKNEATKHGSQGRQGRGPVPIIRTFRISRSTPEFHGILTLNCCIEVCQEDHYMC